MSSIVDEQPQSIQSSLHNNVFLSSSNEEPDQKAQTAYTLAHESLIRNINPGLATLMTLNQLTVQQKADWEDLRCGPRRNEYKILDSQSHLIMRANEEAGYCDMHCSCSTSRPFDIDIKDVHGNIAMSLRGSGGCGPQCIQEQKMLVYSPPRHLVGSIEQEWGIGHVKNEKDEIILKIVDCRQRGNGNFVIMTADEKTAMGRIKPSLRSIGEQILSDANDFDINFATTATLRNKILILATCFLLDFMYYERRSKW